VSISQLGPAISAITGVDTDGGVNGVDEQPQHGVSQVIHPLLGLNVIVAKKKHVMSASACSSQTKRTISSVVEDGDIGDEEDQAERELPRCTFLLYYVRCDQLLNAITAKKKRTTLGNPVATDAEGFLMDIDVQEIDGDVVTHEEKRRDVDQFFQPAIIKDVNGKQKKYRICKLCP
jgi:hypothetical protein